MQYATASATVNGTLTSWAVPDAIIVNCAIGDDEATC